MRVAAAKRPVEPDRLEQVVDSVVRRLESMGETEVEVETIGSLVMDVRNALSAVFRLASPARIAGSHRRLASIDGIASAAAMRGGLTGARRRLDDRSVLRAHGNINGQCAWSRRASISVWAWFEAAENPCTDMLGGYRSIDRKVRVRCLPPSRMKLVSLPPSRNCAPMPI